VMSVLLLGYQAFFFIFSKECSKGIRLAVR